MKCPFRFMGCEIDALKPPETRFLCIQEECAWWSDEHKQCDPTGLLPWLIHIESRLSEIADKVGHGVKR